MPKYTAPVGTPITETIMQGLAALAAAREYVLSHALDCDARPNTSIERCADCGSSAREWGVRLANGTRCTAAWHTDMQA